MFQLHWCCLIFRRAETWEHPFSHFTGITKTTHNRKSGDILLLFVLLVRLFPKLWVWEKETRHWHDIKAEKPRFSPLWQSSKLSHLQRTTAIPVIALSLALARTTEWMPRKWDSFLFQGFLFTIMLWTTGLNTGKRQKELYPVFNHWFPAFFIFPISALCWWNIFFNSFLTMGAYYFWSIYVTLKSFWNICNFYLSLLF